MDIVSAAMSLYLLFPILNERQQTYSELIKKNLTSTPQEVEKRLELEKFLGLDESQYATEEELVLHKNEEEQTETDAAEKKESIAEIYLRGTNNHLKQYEFGEEKFAVGDKEGLRSTVVSVNEETVTRSKYDSSYRIIENIIWKNKSSVSESVLLDKKNWLYTDDSIYMTEENFEDKTFSDTVFNLNKLPVKVSIWTVTQEKKSAEDKNSKTENSSSEKNNSAEKDEVKNKTEAKKNLSSINYFDYDDQNRVVYEKEEFYEHRKNETTGREKDLVVYTAEKKYLYKEGFDSPDFKFYEDGKLSREIQQVSENTYFEFIYFPDGAEVRTKYIDGTKVEENMFLYGDK